jgi:serine/threonine protein kinase
LARCPLEDKNESKKQRPMSAMAFTTPYRPPEVLLEKNNYDKSADIWSLGCIMSEIFTKLTEVQNNLERS